MSNQPVHGIPLKVLYSLLGFESSFLSLFGAEEAILIGISLKASVRRGRNAEHVMAYRIQMEYMTRVWRLDKIV